MLKENLLSRVENFSELGLTGNDVRGFIIGILEENGYSAIVREIKANRNALKNANIGINKICSDMLSERYSTEDLKVIWKPTEEEFERVEDFRFKLKSLAAMVLRHNTEAECEYLMLKDEYVNEMFKLAQAYVDLEGIEDKEEYLEKAEEVNKLREKVDGLEDRLDHYVMYHINRESSNLQSPYQIPKESEKVDIYYMLWVHEEEKWYYKINDFDEEEFEDGFVDYAITVVDGVIIEDDLKSDNEGKLFEDCYDKNLWNE